MKRRQFWLMALCLILSVCVCVGTFGCKRKKKVLEVPVVTISDTGVASWDAVEKASGYKFMVDSGIEQDTQERSVQLLDGQNIRVKAVSGSKKFADSEYSEPQKYTAAVVAQKLGTPVVTVNENGVASWAAVSHASGYVYKINDGEEQTAAGHSVQLTAGQIIIVKAVGAGDRYTDGEYSAPVKYTVTLEVPVVDVDNKGVATWPAQEGATYVYIIDDGEEQSCEEPTLTLVAGQSVVVKAVGDGSSYFDSEYSTSVQYICTLQTPGVAVNRNGLAAWIGIAGATRYKIKLNDGEERDYYSTSYQLTAGDTLCVKAVGQGPYYIDSGYSNVVKYLRKLDAPKVEIDAVGVATWSPVANATGYKYIIDNGDAVTAEDLSVTLTNGQSIKVMALGDGEAYTDGSYCEAVTYTAVSVTGITLGKTSDTINIGDSTKFSVTVAPDNAANKAVTWSSDNTQVATVAADGTVTGVAVGVAHVTATTVDGGHTATAEVTVVESGATVSVLAVSLDKFTITVAKQATHTLTATITPDRADDKEVAWSTNKPEVATVDENGVVTGVAAGIAIITVTTHDGGHTAFCSVIVTEKLEAPTVTATVVGLEWQAVAGATGYKVYKDGAVLTANALTDETLSYQLTENGSYAVVAIGNGSTLLDSDLSEAVEFEVKVAILLGKPTLTVSAGGLATWTDVENASRFEVKVNGVTVNATDNSYLLKEDDIISVRAKGDNITYIDGEAVTATYAPSTEKVYTVAEILALMSEYSANDVSKYRYTVTGVVKSSKVSNNDFVIVLVTDDDKTLQLYLAEFDDGLEKDYFNVVDILKDSTVVCTGYLLLYNDIGNNIIYEMAKRDENKPLITSITLPAPATLVDRALDRLNVASKIEADTTLPIADVYDVETTWSATVTSGDSDAFAVTEAGAVTVTRGVVDATVTVTATVKLGDVESTKNFTVTVPAVPSGVYEDKTVTVSVGTHASANGWTNGTQYSELKLDSNITATAEGGGNTGKYYIKGYEWRTYQTESPVITITAGADCTIKTVKITYNIDNTGILLDSNNEQVASNTVVDVNGKSVTFGVGNTGTATNGQVKITAIEVVYSAPKPVVRLTAPEVTVDADGLVTLGTVAEATAYKYKVKAAGAQDFGEEQTYTAPFEVADGSTVIAMAVGNGVDVLNSAYGSEVPFTLVTTPLAAPTVAINLSGLVTITAAEGATKILYKVNGGEEQIYTAPFTVSDTDSVTAMAQGNGKSVGNSGWSTAEVYHRPAEPQKLAKPTVSISRDGTVTITHGDATAFKYKICETGTATDYTAPFEVEALDEVFAMAVGDGIATSNSDYSDGVIYMPATKLARPDVEIVLEGTKANTVYICWDAVSGATAYKCSVLRVGETDYEDLEVDLDDDGDSVLGEITLQVGDKLKVKAIGDTATTPAEGDEPGDYSGRYDDSDYCTEITFAVEIPTTCTVAQALDIMHYYGKDNLPTVDVTVSGVVSDSYSTGIKLYNGATKDAITLYQPTYAEGLYKDLYATGKALVDYTVTCTGKLAIYGTTYELSPAQVTALTAPELTEDRITKAKGLVTLTANSTSVLLETLYGITVEWEIVAEDDAVTLNTSTGAISITPSTTKALNVLATATLIKDGNELATKDFDFNIPQEVPDNGDVTVVFADKGYANAEVVAAVQANKSVSLTFAKSSSSTAPTYYTTGTGIRLYNNGGQMTVSLTAENKTITAIYLTFHSDEDDIAITADKGEYTDTPKSNGVWTGTATEVTFTAGGTKGNRRLQSVRVVYEPNLPALTAPVISADSTNPEKLVWSAVEGATGYTVKKGDATVATVTTLYYVTEESGSYTVVANGNGTTHKNSAPSNAVTITFTQLDAPVIAYDDTNTALTWTGVANATGYNVYKDNGTDPVNVTPLAANAVSYSLTAGEYGSYTVVALGGGLYITSPASNAINYTESGGETTVTYEKTLNITEECSKHSDWTIGGTATKVEVLNIDENITATTLSSGNHGKLYGNSNSANWRIYQNGTVTIATTTTDYTLVSIKIKFSNSKLHFESTSGPELTSDTEYTVSGNSVVVYSEATTYITDITVKYVGPANSTGGGSGNEGGNTGGETEAKTVTTNFNALLGSEGQKLSNNAKITEVTDGEITYTFAKASGSNDPIFHTSSPNYARTYAKNTLTISVPTGYSITALTIKFTNKNSGSISYNSNAITSETKFNVATADANSVVITTSNSGQVGYVTITVEYQAPATRSVTGTWTRVTDASQLYDGAQVVIASADGTYALGSAGTNSFTAVATGLSAGTASATEFANFVNVVTLTSSGNRYTLDADEGLLCATGNGDLTAGGNAGNANSQWKITFAADGSATLVAGGDVSTNCAISYANGEFACARPALATALTLYVLS